MRFLALLSIAALTASPALAAAPAAPPTQASPAPKPAERTFTFTFTEAEANVIASLLSEAPYRIAQPMLTKMQQQVAAQAQPPAPAK